MSHTTSNQNLKTECSISATKLQEHFTLGITDPTDPTWQDANGNFLIPHSHRMTWTNGGSPFVWASNQSATIEEQAVFIQDDIAAATSP